jgi:WD40 repeat protein
VLGPPLNAPSGAALDLAPPVGPTPFEVPEGARYDPGGLLGVGGMGEVRQARDERLGRDVAVKTASVGASAVDLVREARLTSRLVHPNIIAVHDAGVDEAGRPFYTMPVLRGRSLAEVIQSAPDLAARLQLVPHVLAAVQAVAYAHGEGVLHRDLKPANIMVGGFGETLVADWGLAAPFQEGGGEVVGTPGYLSPEAAAGGPVDGRSDVYGLGCVLWEVLTGRPQPTAEQRARPPRELAAIAARATHPDPEGRYPDARAMARDLDAWFQGREVAAYSYSTRELVERLVRRWWSAVVVGSVSAVLLAVAVGYGWWSTVHQRDAARSAERSAVLAREASDASLVRALAAQARHAAQVDPPWRAEVLATHALSVGSSPTARGVLARLGGRPRPTAVRSLDLPSCASLTLSPAGSLALCVRGGEATIFDPAAPDAILHRAVVDGFHGEWVDEHTVVLSTQSMVQLRWTPPEPPRALAGALLRHARFTPLPGGVLLAMGTGGVGLYGPEGDEVAQVAVCPGGVMPGPVGSGRGGEVFVGCQDGSVWSRDAGGRRRERLRLPAEQGVPSAVGVSADGPGWLVVGTARGRMVVVNERTGEQTVASALGAEAVARVVVRGDRAAVALNDGQVWVWALNPPREVARLDGYRHQLQWSDVDGSLRVVGARATWWELPDPGLPDVIPMPGGVSGVDVSPTEPLAAAGCGNGEVVAVSLVDGSERWRRRLGSAVVKDVAFSPDGALLATAMSQNVPQLILSTVDGRPVDALGATGSKRVVWTPSDVLMIVPFGQGVLLRDPAHQVQILPGMEIWDLEAGATAAYGVSPSGEVWVFGQGSPWPMQAVGVVDEVAASGDSVWSVEGDRLNRRTQMGTLTRSWRVDGRAVEIASSADGRRAAVGRIDGVIQLYDEGADEPIALLDGHLARVSTLAFTDDGQWLVSGSWDETVRTWYLGDLDAPPADLLALSTRRWQRSLEDALATSTAWSAP